MSTTRYSFLAEPGASGSEFRMDLDESRSTDANIAGFARTGKLYEPDIAAVLTAVLRGGDVFVDVGAHIGFFTLMGSRLVGSSGRVIAVEPDPENAGRLRKHLELNGCDNVSVVEQPVSNLASEVDFYTNSDDGGGNALWDPGLYLGNVRSQANRITRRVRATTLDEVCRGRRAPKLIKIDTEGAETQVLEGARGLLAGREVPFVVSEYHLFGLERMGSSPERLRDLMLELGYATFLLSYRGLLPKLVPPATEIESEFILNVLFSSVEMVGSYWPVETIDPRTS